MVLGLTFLSDFYASKSAVLTSYTAAVAAIQYVRLDLITAGPWYVVLRSTLKSYFTRYTKFTVKWEYKSDNLTYAVYFAIEKNNHKVH